MSESAEMTDLNGKHLHMTSSGTVDPAPKHRGVKIGLSVCCLLFGLVCLALGIAIPFVVNNAIRTGIIDAALLDPSKFSATAAQNFYNQSSNEDFYLYNCTNLYAVLTTGASPNFQEVGPVKTKRYPNRYNVSWDTANSKVTYQWLTTFEVLPESQHFLDMPIIGPNVFYLGMQAQVMRTALGTNTTGIWQPTARFAGNYLSEKVGITGFLGGKIIPGFINAVFKDVSKSALLQGIRGAGLIYYNGYLTGFCAAVCGLGPFTLPEVWSQWARATSAQGFELLPTASSYFAGFSLDSPLNTTNPDQVAANFFNTTGAWGLTAAGLQQWGKLAAYAAISPSLFTAQRDLIGAGLQIDPQFIPYDVPKIGAWVSKFSNSLPSSKDANNVAYGAAFMKTVTTAISGSISKAVGQQAATATTFAQLYASTADYSPASWDDLGALQFGSGALVAGFLLPTQPLFLNGKGLPLNVLKGNVVDPDTPLNFADMATEPEPMEFTAGIAYYVKHNSNLSPEQTAARLTWPAGADETQLWTDNPALLYFNNTGAFHQLSVTQTNKLFNQLLVDPSGYGNILTAAATVAGYYAAGYKGARGQGAPIATAIASGNNQAMSKYTALASDPTSWLNRTDVQAFLTRENYYAVYTYLFHYLGNELSGPLSQLDPNTGLAPQNNGLFTQMTVSEMLFGSSTKTGSVVQYRARFPTVEIPTIGGPLLNSAPEYQTLLDQDYAQHLDGRRWVQDTGHNEIATVGQWIEWEGTSQYQYACDLNDPARTQDCSPAGSNNEASNNWAAWGAPAVLKGSGSSTQIAPFLEKTSQILPKLSFYVAEVRRPVTVQYQSDVEIQGINMRRYNLWPAIIYENYTQPAPNTEKNDEMWYQANVPDGLYSVQTVKGGVPAVVSIPHFGLVPNGTINQGVTCNGVPCTGPSSPYDPALHETYLAIEPMTGFTMKGAKRLQANFRVSAKEYFTGQSFASYPAYPAALPPGYNPPPALAGLGGLNYHYNNLFANGRETIYIPYYWADIHDEIQPADAQKARDSLAAIERARQASLGVRIAGIIGGVIISALSVIALIMLCKK